ncbi:uncharacterized protein MYCGRDRAFT_96900 [Zymoseptoria tritici IPO323]|uniref:Condensation domain-containing protein n=1 Tax=Zymoseptoria tritici (strain CBS 115943 / IPO323) TaxID=336722 RepID=F9XPF4_ZYMTI|nr:uncharacterized protein MYCGRDRAFT_96900 [Zymoseptoria tritici IPO323]EGP82833.1 hypothetical protein MYCGRDRAFT_96900 [Zymoseptoria tritici IPO323]
MAELSLFPPQRDRSNSAATGLWTSHPHVAEIGSSSQDWTDIDFETCLDLAFAALIWAYTGDDSPCFVSTHLAKADRRRFSHVLKAGVTTTLAEAVRSIRNVGVLLNDAMEAPSMLVHVPRDQGCFDNWTSTTTGKSSIPLQLFAEREGGTSAAPLQDLDVLTDHDRNFITGWNSTAQQLDSRTVHDRVSQVALRDPDKLAIQAIQAWDGELSRGDLEQATDALAHLLRQANIQRGCVIGILMNKSNYIVCILDILHTLIAGGTVCIPSPGERTNNLAGAIRRLRPDFVRLTPSVLKVLDPDQVPSIRTVVSAGEAMQRSLAEKWLTSGRVRMRNGYGQSEACGTNSTAEMALSTANFRSIGSDSRLGFWVADPWKHDRLMPVGAMGELILEGHSVAHEYLDEPGKTAAAFISTPRWAVPFGAGADRRRCSERQDRASRRRSGRKTVTADTRRWQQDQASEDGADAKKEELNDDEIQSRHSDNGQLEVTDFQAEYLPRKSGSDRGLLYKFDLTLQATADPERLLQTLYRWAESTGALRLSFIREDNKLPLQFVLPPEDTRWRSRVYSLSKVDDVDELSARHDFVRHPLLAAVYTASGCGRDVVHIINHGVFDGISLGHLLEDLLSIYLGRPVTPRPSFTNYLSDRLLRQSPETLAYWKSLLRGSSPTSLRSMNDMPTRNNVGLAYSSAEHHISRTIYLQRPADSPYKASMSSVVQSAWSLVLSVLSQRTDVMSLCLMHGRDEEMLGSDSIVGPCVSEIPLRIQLRDSMNSTDLVDLVQRQMWESAPHAHLGSSTIAAKCTDWPELKNRYQHSSFVQHQGVIIPYSMPIADEGHLQIAEPEVEHALTYDFDLLTKSAHPNELYLSLRCLQDSYTSGEARTVADAFVAAVRTLVGGSMSVNEMLARISSIPSLPIVALA